jgi:hypothetical protein
VIGVRLIATVRAGVASGEGLMIFEPDQEPARAERE